MADTTSNSADAESQSINEKIIMDYVLTEFAKDHRVDKNSVQVVSSKNKDVYDLTLFYAEVQVTHDKTVGFYLDPRTSKIYPYKYPSFNELIGVGKLSYNLWKELKNKTADETMNLILGVRLPADLKQASDVFPEEEYNKFRELRAPLKEKLTDENLSQEEKEQVLKQLEELRKQEAAIAEEAQARLNKEVFAENEARVHQIYLNVMEKLETLPDVQVTSSPDISPIIGISTPVRNIDSIAAMPEIGTIDVAIAAKG